MDLKEFKLLMVGAGGIGCELLKNLVLSGFTQIHVIDLDTIELSNLNRQFLFQKCHVGKPKATTARESVLRYNPDADIVASHDSIMNTKYDVEYFKQFAIVLNALDNKAARSHVNRLCLAADVPLIESGSAGYLGQVTLIKKGQTECYDCLPKPAAKTFPGCTIRNTPSEPIHCIVWAKHLFNQLFGAEDPDEAVSPDGEDPENMAEAGQTAAGKTENQEAVTRVSTRQWAKETSYNSEKLFNKLFGDDIKYLLSMAKLWENRKPPTPLKWGTCVDNETILDQVHQQASTSIGKLTEEDPNKLASHKILSMKQYCDIFRNSVALLKNRLESSEDPDQQILVWDKDDLEAMNFVTAASNLRCFIFGITLKSQFETKSLAGNIIPAIATTNAIVAGLIVVQALKVLENKLDECKTAYVRDKPSSNKVIVGTQLVKPNEKCYVCASKPEISVKLNMNTFTVKQFETKILKRELHMHQPDMEVDDGTGRIIISSEPGETDGNNEKFLSNFFGESSQVTLRCEDFLQNYELKIILFQCDTFEDSTKEYEIFSENQMLKDLQADLEANKEATKTEVSATKSDDLMLETSVASPINPEEKKRSYDAAFEGEDTSKSTKVECKKARRSNETEGELIEQNECDLVEDASNSINDASDALSEEEEQIVQPKVAKKTRTPRETIIDDDIIIEEDSNDFKSDEDISDQMNENSNNWNQNSNQNQRYTNDNTNSNLDSITNTNTNDYTDYNGASNGDDDIIECSSTSSDIIEINEESNQNSRESETSWAPIQTHNGNHQMLSGNNSNNGHINNGNMNNNENKNNGMGYEHKENYQANIENEGLNGKVAAVTNNEEDSITLID